MDYLGHIIDQEGIHPDQEKLAPIAELEPPTDVTGVRSLRGMVSHLGKFIPNLADLTKPIRDLIVTTNDWICGETQQSGTLANSNGEFIENQSSHYNDDDVILIPQIL